MFDGKGNYMYHAAAFVKPLASAINVDNVSGSVSKWKHDIGSQKCFSNVVLPQNCEQPVRMWADSQPDDVSLQW